MPFDLDKQHILSRDDKSIKGSFDKPIKALLGFLNEHDDYYTTSSCSGRIVALAPGKSKHDSIWLLKSHEQVGIDELTAALEQLPQEKVVFRAQPLILHVTCRTLDAAKELLSCAHSSGLKRSGVLVPFNANRVLIEGHDRMAAPIAVDGRLLVDDAYLSVLLEEANGKLSRNLSRIERFERTCRERLAHTD